MARVLAYTSPARGHLFPITPTLDELRERGHDVSVRTLASELELMRLRGFDAGPIAERIEEIEHDDHRARSPQGAIKRALGVFAARARHDAEDLRAAIEQERPDAVLVDVNAWGATAAAQAWGGPWAMWCPYPLPLPSRDTPPFGPGFAPAGGLLGRLRDRALAPLIIGGFTREIVPRVNALRTELGLSRVRSVTELFGIAPVVLYTTAEPFEYHHSDWPASVRMIGPCAWEPPADPPPWLAGIDRPIVLVTTSSEFQDDGRLVATALEALRDEPVFVVATLPAQDASRFEAPPNARVETFVPHGPILARAACAVTHGGMGATQKAIAQGVPVCAVPFGRDQMEVARRVEVSGAGTRLPARRLNPRRLRAAVRDAMQRADGARRVADAFARAGGGAAGADAVEEVLGSRVASVA